MRTTRLAVAAIGLALAATGLVTAVPGSASSADDGPFELYALKSPGLSVTSGSCRYISFTARSTAGDDIESVEAEVDIWNHGEYLSSVSLNSEAGDPTRLSGRYYYCPYEGVGVMRLGPSQVDYYDYDYNSGDFIDTTRGSADIRQGVKTTLEVKQSGEVRTFTAGPKYFATGWAEEWTRYPKGVPVRLQRQAATGAGSWTKVAVAKVNRRGKVVFSVRAGKKFAYRVVADGTQNSRPLKSRRVVA